MTEPYHKKLDGYRYPDGLKAEAISLPARILVVTEIRNTNIEIRNPDETEESFIGQAIRAKYE